MSGKAKSVAELLKENPNLVLQPNNKILCKVTKHELPTDAKIILQHLEGKKYKKAVEWYSHDYDQYFPDIVPHKVNDHKLFCTLTKQELNKIPVEVQKHVSGKRFLRYVPMIDTITDLQ